MASTAVTGAKRAARTSGQRAGAALDMAIRGGRIVTSGGSSHADLGIRRGQVVISSRLISLRAGNGWSWSLRDHVGRLAGSFRRWSHGKQIAIGLWADWARHAHTGCRHASRHRWRRSGVLEALSFILRKAWTRRRAHHISTRTQPLLIILRRKRTGAVLRFGMVEFVVGPVVTARITLVLVEECDNIDDSLGILLLLLFCYAIGL